MEAILVVILIAIFWIGIGYILSLTPRVGKSVIDTARGKGSLRENLSLNFNGVSNTTFRIIEENFETDGGKSFPIWKFEMKGLLPNIPMGGTDLSISISLFDAESGYPILTLIDDHQEAQTRIFLNSLNIGQTRPDTGFVRWVQIGVALKETLIPPYSGNRNIYAMFHFTSSYASNYIIHGTTQVIPPEHVFGSYSTNRMGIEPKQKLLIFDSPGYLEVAENSDKSQFLIIQLAVIIAMVDGKLDSKEGDVIKQWSQKYVEDFQGERRENAKTLMNQAMQEAFDKVNSGEVDRESIIYELIELGQKRDHFEAMELLMDIMAADDVAHSSELQFVNHVGEKLGISVADIQNMKDLRLLNNQNIEISENNLEDILRINPETMSKDEICQIVQDQFLQWNSRIQSLNTQEDRQQAQTMLDIIAEAQIKYCD